MKKVLILLLMAASCGALSAQREKGFGLNAEVGFGARLSQNDFSVYQFHVSPGYHFSKYVFVGAGVGVSYHHNGVARSVLGSTMGMEFTSIPLYAHATVSLPTGSSWSPFLSLKVGYGFLDYAYESLIMMDGKECRYSHTETSGLYFAPALGVKYRMSCGHAISLSVAYDTQARSVSDMYYEPVDPSIGFSGARYGSEANSPSEALTVRLGWEF